MLDSENAPNNVLPVLEVFVHGHWAPWAIFLQESEEAAQQAIESAELRLMPLRYRMSTTDHWGGPQKTLERMVKCFGHNCN